MEELLPMNHDAVVGDFSGDYTGDIGGALLLRYQQSPRDEHKHLCAVVGAMAQELRDQNLPLTPVAYFCAALASLIRLSSPPSVPDPVVPALLAVLSAALSKVPPAVLRQKGGLALETVEKALRLESMPLGGMKAGLSCIPLLFAAGDQSSWSNLAGSYGMVLSCVTDNRPEVKFWMMNDSNVLSYFSL